MTMISLEDAVRVLEKEAAFANDDASYQAGLRDATKLLRSAEPAQPVAWPTLDKPAQVGGGRFDVGQSARLVVEAAQRHYEYMIEPEREAERIKRADKFLDAITSPQMPPMTDEEITLLLAKEMSHAVTNGLNMQQMTLRLCRAVRGER